MKKRSEAVDNEATNTPAEPKRDVIADARQRAHDEGERRDRAARKAEGDAGPNVFPSGDEGETVTVEGGGYLFAPKQFNNLTTARFATTTRVRSGETRVDAMRRARAQIAIMEREDFEARLKVFRECYPRLFEGQG